MGNNRNVIVGAAQMYVSAADSSMTGTGAAFWQQSSSGPWGPPLPSFTAGQTSKVAFKASSAWNDMGYTTDGVEVSYEPDYGEVVVDQELDSVKMFKQAMRVSVRTTLAEATLENLVLSWGQQTNTKKGTAGADEEVLIASGELGDDPLERALAFVGNAPRGANNAKRERVYHIRRALQVESSAHSLSRADATTVPVSFRCLPDSSFANEFSGQSAYGRILQRVVS